MTRAFFLSVLLLITSIFARTANVQAASETNSTRQIFNVRNFGAKGDGKVKDTAALQKTLDACTQAGGGTVIFPAGVYLTGSIVLGSNTRVQLERNASLLGSAEALDYPLGRVRWEGEFSQGHCALISAGKATNVSIAGPGSIFGPPITLGRLRDPRGPVLLEFTECTNVLLEGFSTQYQQLWSIHPVLCRNVTARNLTIRSINVNGDGIDVDSCRDVLIENCDINSGDDAIAIKSGRGLEAIRLGCPTENVVIRGCSLASSMFGGIGIGTEMSGGVRQVKVENCIISGHKNAILIKSREGRGGFMEDITFENIVIQNSPNFLSIDLLTRGIQAREPVTKASEKWSRVRNLTFRNVQVRDVDELVSARNVSPEQPVDGLTLANITGTCRKGITLVNVTGAKLTDIKVTGFAGELVTMSGEKASADK